MPNQGNPLLSVRVPQDLNQLLEARAAEEGLDRSKVALAALRAYLFPQEPQDEISQIKSQLAALQAALGNLTRTESNL
jgi:metal-responsive CopG/Arc/MetJ family transcriptional regulator